MFLFFFSVGIESCLFIWEERSCTCVIISSVSSLEIVEFRDFLFLWVEIWEFCFEDWKGGGLLISEIGNLEVWLF